MPKQNDPPTRRCLPIKRAISIRIRIYFQGEHFSIRLCGCAESVFEVAVLEYEAFDQKGGGHMDAIVIRECGCACCQSGEDAGLVAEYRRIKVLLSRMDEQQAGWPGSGHF